jgi:iron-sulfur cluster repair protein YtfE (RIC family)
MLTLSTVEHEHHALLRDYVNRLYALADCLSSDCLDTVGALAELAELHALERGLREMLVPHMEAVEAAVYPTVERIMVDRESSVPMRHEHEEIRRLVASFGKTIETADSHLDRGCVLALRRVMLRLHVLLRTHLDEEELYVPILEGCLTPEGEAALARALDHMAEARL